MPKVLAAFNDEYGTNVEPVMSGIPFRDKQ
jgi:hypothetical protein